MANTLFLRLEGPLQAWGERGRWGVRDTAPEPTKSGVIGLLGCALGISEDEPLRHLSDSLRMGVRVDRPGTRLTDYHTTGGGFERPMMLTSQGKFKDTPELSWRDYLCDASFLVALQSDDQSLIQQLADGVKNPVWPFYLGRKACIPAEKLFVGIDHHPDLVIALRQHPLPPRPKEKLPIPYTIIETAPTAENALRRNDNLLSRHYQTYAPRYVVIAQQEVKQS